MAVSMNARWDNNGTVIPGGDAEYVVSEQPIAEYDNWFNYNIVADIQAVIDDVINRFNANTILKADTDNTPAALVVAEQTIVGRKTGNSIAALTDAEVLAIIGVAAGATKYPDTGEQAFLDADHSKLDGIELLADVTDSTNVSSSGAVMDSDFSAAEGFMRKTGSETYTAIKSNMGASVAPTVDEDSGDGYAVGSRWLDTTSKWEYVCLVSSVGAAVWERTTSALRYIITDDVLYTNVTERSIAGTGAWIKSKELVISGNTNAIRIYYECRSATATTIETRIYLNGSPVGETHSHTTGTSWANHTEDFIGILDGDLIQIYTKAPGGAWAVVKNLTILGVNVDVVAIGATNNDP